jgi:hypothetical protein
MNVQAAVPVWPRHAPPAPPSLPSSCSSCSPCSCPCLLYYNVQTPLHSSSPHSPALLFVLLYIFHVKNLMLQFFLVKRILMKWENLKRLIKKLSPTFVIKNPSLCFRMSLLLKSLKKSWKNWLTWPAKLLPFTPVNCILTTLFRDFDFFDKIMFFFSLDVWFPRLWVIYNSVCLELKSEQFKSASLFILTVNILNFFYLLVTTHIWT